MTESVKLRGGPFDGERRVVAIALPHLTIQSPDGSIAEYSKTGGWVEVNGDRTISYDFVAPEQ